MTTGYKLDRKPYAEAMAFAEAVAAALAAVGVPRECVHFAGSLRRGKPTVGDLDLLIVTETGRERWIYGALLAELENRGHGLSVQTHGDRWLSVQVDGFLVECKQSTPDAFGAAILFMTGSGDFNMQMRKFAKLTGFKLSQYGLFNRVTGDRVAAASEREIFDALGVEYIAPEDRGEFHATMTNEAAQYIDAPPVRFVPAVALPDAEPCRVAMPRNVKRVPCVPKQPREPDVDPVALGLAFEIRFAAVNE